MVSSIRWSFDVTKRWVSLTCVEKLHANKTREQYYDLRQKLVIRATGLSKQCTDTDRDSHDATRHKLRRTLAYSFQQFHLPFHLQFGTLDLFSRFTVWPDGRTPFQHLLGTSYVSPLCMFGESVFALIPDDEVRAAKLTNMWISGCWWWQDASSDEHLLGTKHGLLKCSSVRRKPPGEHWSQRETIEARGTKWNFDVERDSGIPGPTLEPRRDEGMPTATAPIQYIHLHLRQKSTYLKCEVKECTRKHSGSELSGQKSADLPDARHVRLPVRGSHTLVNARRIKMFGTRAAAQHQRRRRNVELLEIRTHDRWTRVRVQQIRTRRDQKQPLWQTTRARRTKWMKITSKEVQRHLINWNQSTMRMCRRRHEWLERRCEIWCQRGSLAKRKKSSRWKICSCTPGSKRLTYLPTNRFCSQVGLDDWRGVKWGREVCWRISRRQWEMTYSRQHHSPVSVRGLLLYAAWFDLQVETGDLVCAFMQTDSSCEMFARPPTRQERDGWIWRLHGAMNGMRTASRDFTEFLAGILTEHMGFKNSKLERCLFVHESNEARVVSHVDDPLICAKPMTLDKHSRLVCHATCIGRLYRESIVITTSKLPCPLPFNPFWPLPFLTTFIEKNYNKMKNFLQKNYQKKKNTPY